MPSSRGIGLGHDNYVTSVMKPNNVHEKIVRSIGRMDMVKIKLILGASILLLCCGQVNAALIDQLDGTVLDTDLKIFWLQDANTAKSNTFGVGGIATNGEMYWDTAKTWINAMNTEAYLGFTNWRLPTTVQPDSTCVNQSSDTPPQGSGVGCTGSEMGHLYTLEGITSSSSGPFSNVEFSDYWSGTEYAPDPTNLAWRFDFHSGGVQGASSKSVWQPNFAWAVRDVCSEFPGGGKTEGCFPGPGPFPAPEPPAILLFGIGLIGLIGFSKRRKAA